VSALRAVFTVFGASAGFDRQQGADLHLVGVEVLAMYGLRRKHQIAERLIKQAQYFFFTPVVTHGSSHKFTLVSDSTCLSDEYLTGSNDNAHRVAVNLIESQGLTRFLR